jgi:hypothetical protein
MKTIQTLFLTFLVGNMTFAQSEHLHLDKGKWSFYVLLDSISNPYPNDQLYSTIKFKRSGRYIESRERNGQKEKSKGGWKLTGATLTMDQDDGKNYEVKPKAIHLTIVDQDTFYSPQPDVKTVYWLFTRTE